MPDKPAEPGSTNARHLLAALEGLADRGGQQFRSLTTLMVGLNARLDAIDARLDAIDVSMRAMEAAGPGRAELLR